VVTAGINADAITAAKIADNAVVTAGINADAVTGAEIADDAINSEHYTDGSIDTAHIADGQVTIGKLATAVLTGATDIGAAIADADLLLVDDGAGGTLRKTAASRLKTYVGSNTPSFLANKSSAQSIANTTAVQVTFDNELYDSDGKFASNRFTPTVAGKYFIYSQLNMVATDGKYFETRIHKNGTLISVTQTHMGTVTYNAGSYIGQVITSDDNDYFEIFTYHNSGASKNVDGGNTGSSYFGAFKIIE